MRHDSKLKAPPPPGETMRGWLTGLVVIASTIIAFVGFARLSFGWTLAVSTLLLIGLLSFLYSVGIRKERERAARNKRV